MSGDSKGVFMKFQRGEVDLVWDRQDLNSSCPIDQCP